MFAGRISCAALALSLASASACNDTPPETVAFSPLGTDAELYGEWDVNALVPTTEICARAGIDTVEVAFSNATDTESFTSADLRFPCGPGYYDSTGPVLRAGTFGYRWRAYSGDTIVLESRRYSATVTQGQELVLMPVDFVRRINVRVDVSLAWATGSGDGTCAAAFVDTMSWELRRGTSTGTLVATSNGGVACADTFSIPDLPTGSLEAGGHTLVVHGAATDGAAWNSECAVTVFESGPSMATCSVPSAP